MTKHMPPPLKMRVERGRLIPATSFDAERLDSYRVGSTVNVRFTADRMRPLERKYRAILSKVIKECETPWSNAEAAHQAIKLSCGIINVGKTANGEFFQWPRSLVDLDDKEMEEYFNDAVALLERLTGVDVDTLKRETAHVDQVDDDDVVIDPETGEITDPGASPSAPADDEHSPAQSSTEDSVIPAPSERVAESSPIPQSRFEREELNHLRDFARKSMDDADSKMDEPAKITSLDTLAANYREALTSVDASQALEAMRPAFDAVAAGKRTREQAEDYIARDLLGIPVDDLRRRA